MTLPGAPIGFSGNLFVVFLHRAPLGRRGDFVVDDQIRIDGRCREIR
jgi:hypothetical protein